MKLYFAPLACSLATRISLYEVGAPALKGYRERLLERPSVARAFAEELRLYQAAQGLAKAR